MTDANFAYSLLCYLCNKHQGSEPSPDEYRLIMKQAQASFQSFLIGEATQQQYGRPIARVSLGQNQHIYDSLSPFFVDAPLDVVNGIALKPADWEATVNMRSTTSFQDYRFVQRDSFNNWRNSVIDPVAANPIYTTGATGFKFTPTTFTAAMLTYVQTPPETIWAFTLDTNGLPVYDAANSIGLLWATKDVFEVIARALRLVGISLQASAVMQLSNEIINKGQ